ncbi:MAG: T9SS type A sorting domain-containing protein, partial [Candidatus Kapabacteria bacterium]|nr:T9SS type A sorting domain-containing protein [Candidatus Kapabacteria bacterium]
FVVGHPQHRNAGFNLTFRDNVGSVGTLTAGPNTKVQGNELTHTGPTAFNGAAARFAFQWTAPGAHGTYNFAGVGNAINNDGNDSDADDWALTGNIAITVTGANFTKPTAGTTICAGSQISIEWNQTGLGTVRIEMSKDNFASTQTINTLAASGLSTLYTIPTDTEAGSYIIRMVDATTSEEIARTAAITVQAGPNIVLQPLPTFVCEGKTLTLTVSASGTNAQYRWRKDGVDIAGGTNSVLTIRQVDSTHGGLYQCVVFACNSNASSEQVLVTIGRGPVIVTQPVPRQRCEGDSASFSVRATGSDLRYQWLKNGATLPGDTLSVLRFDRVNLLDEATYTCRVEGACSPTLTTNPVTLTVLELPTIKTQPVDRSLRERDTLTLSVEAGGEELVFQWLRDGKVLASTNNRVLRIAGVTRADSGLYTCVVSNRCDTVTSKQALVKVAPIAGPGRLTLTASSISLGTSVACLTVDTTLTGLLVNDGGAPITVTSISAEPVAKIEVVGLRAPFDMQPNERRNLQIRISPNAPGPYDAKVTFFASSGQQTVMISGDGAPALRFAKDTLIFPTGQAGTTLCNPSFAIPCAATKITGVRLAGAGALSWGFAPFPDTPIDLKNGDVYNLCVQSVLAEGDAALVSVSTDLGLVTFHVVRSDVTSVDEDDRPVPAGSVRVFPNPAVSDVNIMGSSDETLNVSIYTVTGQLVQTLQGRGELRWDRRDISGAVVNGGLYVMSIDGSSSGRSLRKVLLY